MNLSSFHARLAFVAQFRSSPSSSLVRLVQSETRRARLSVRARKPFGGQVLFTARTVPGRVVDAFTTRASRLSAENVAVERVERVVLDVIVARKRLFASRVVAKGRSRRDFGGHGDECGADARIHPAALDAMDATRCSSSPHRAARDDARGVETDDVDE